jgi:hypothetical protein
MNPHGKTEIVLTERIYSYAGSRGEPQCEGEGGKEICITIPPEPATVNRNPDFEKSKLEMHGAGSGTTMKQDELKSYAAWCNDCVAGEKDRAGICASCKQLTHTCRKIQEPYHFRPHPFNELHRFFRTTTMKIAGRE